MRITQAQLNQHLPPKQWLFVLVGDEPLFMTECMDAIRTSARAAGAAERASFIVERYFNWQHIQQFTQHFSLFSEQRILEINIPTGKPGVDGAKVLETLVNEPPADTTVIISLPKADRDMSNSNWFKALQQGVVLDLASIEPARLPAWIASRLQAQGQNTSEASLQFIAHLVEGNSLAAHQEIQKLGLLYPAGTISDEAVKACVLNVARFDAFQLGESMLQGDSARTMRILTGLQEEGEQAVAVMNPLVWLLRPMLKIKLAVQQGTALNQAMTQAKVFGDRQNIMKRGVDLLQLKHIEAALEKLAEIDRIAKGVKQGDAWLELSRLCVGLARITGRTRRV